MSTIVDIDILKIDHFISQGDIFKNVKYIYRFDEKKDYIDIKEITFPYVIILSQACDMRGSFEIRKNNGKSTKQMISVLVAPLFDKSKVQNGEYLKEIYKNEQNNNRCLIEKGFNSKEFQVIENDYHYRYHYLLFKKGFSLVPESIIDFKQYFTLNIDYLYENI